MAEQPQIVFRGAEDGELTRIEDYEAVGGFQALAKARSLPPDDVIAEVEASGLRGRGGAGFPTGRKWAFVPKPEQLPKPHYLVVNADESEPGTFKDREIMLRVPFRFLEGCLIGAHAIQSKHVFIYIRGEYEREFEVLRESLEAMRARGDLLGDVTVVVHRGAGAYICGEETALLESLEGKRGQPRTKPPFPAVAGLYAAPTAVNNVESVTTVTAILELGAEEYAKLGVENSTGTRVFSLSGDVVNPGNYELPHGISLRELIYDIGGGVPNGRELKAIIPGGSSTPVLTAEDIDATLDFDSMVQAGSSIGSAGVIVIDDRCCMVQLGIRVSQFYEHESCGKCTPCRVGTRWVTQILQKIEDGRAAQADLDLLLSVCDRILGKCLCPLGDSDAIAVLSYVDRFRDEYQAPIDLGGCPFHGDSSLEGILAPSAMHERASHEPTPAGAA